MYHQLILLAVSKYNVVCPQKFTDKLVALYEIALLCRFVCMYLFVFAFASVTYDVELAKKSRK